MLYSSKHIYFVTKDSTEETRGQNKQLIIIIIIQLAQTSDRNLSRLLLLFGAFYSTSVEVYKKKKKSEKVQNVIY